MSTPVPFSYGDKEVRTVEIDGEPWFVARDVCAVLGIRNVGNVLAALDEDERRDIQIMDVTGRSQDTAITSESGLYSIIMRCRRPEAKPFRRWVTAEVLPTIRRTGSYSIAQSAPETVPVVANDPFDILTAMVQQMRATHETAQLALTSANDATEEAKVANARLDAIEGRHEWYAALGYARLNGLPTSAIYLQRLGTTAGQIGRTQGLQPNRVQHALYGEVNQWPAHIWDRAVEARRAMGEPS